MAGKNIDGEIRCSFCGKTQNQVKRLIAGPNGAYICDECIDICADIIDEEYKEYICVRFERPNNNNGFDFAEIIMPDKKFIKAFGFSEDELYWIESFAADNLLLMWEMAKESKQIA